MLSELISTLMLTCAIGTPMLQPKRVNNFGTIHGTYVFRDDFSSYLNEYNQKYTSSGEHEIDFSNQYGDTAFKCLFNNNGVYYYGIVETFTIRVDFLENDIYMNITMDDNGTSNFIFLDYEDISSADTLNEIVELNSSNRDNVKYHTLYVDNYINFAQEQYDLFNCFYTQSGNSYNQTYSGWYNFVGNVTSSGYSTFRCQVVVDNEMYQLWHFEPSNQLWVQNILLDTQESVQEIYKNNQYKIESMNVYINGMLPGFARTKLESIGNFGFVPQPVENYTFSEFFFSIMDAPLYFITSLFSFELFGVQLYVAFTSLLTLAIVVIVIKKVY